MPKKTRKEKILAEYRRKLKLLETKNTPEIFVNKPKESKEEKELIEHEGSKIKEELINHEDDKKTLGYFFQDLKKSVFFITVIIAIEVLLYFVSI